MKSAEIDQRQRQTLALLQDRQVSLGCDSALRAGAVI
jgi:hypothetical protein